VEGISKVMTNLVQYSRYHRGSNRVFSESEYGCCPPDVILSKLHYKCNATGCTYESNLYFTTTNLGKPRELFRLNKIQIPWSGVCTIFSVSKNTCNDGKRIHNKYSFTLTPWS
jgi:hypothetical protein